MRYEEFKARESLSDYIQLIWVMESESDDETYPRERIMPDGIVELVFHYRQPFVTYRADGSRYDQSSAFAISQMREFIEIESAGSIGFISVRFFPWGAYHFFQKPINSFLDDAISIDQLWPEEAAQIKLRIREAHDVQSKKELLEDFLEQQLELQKRANAFRVGTSVAGKLKHHLTGCFIASLGLRCSGGRIATLLPAYCQSMQYPR